MTVNLKLILWAMAILSLSNEAFGISFGCVDHYPDSGDDIAPLLREPRQKRRQCPETLRGFRWKRLWFKL